MTMGIGLGIQFNHRLDLECVFCHQSMSDHASGCIQALCEYWSNRRLYHTCPVCHKKQVDLNTADFFECRSCHTQFSTSEACGEDAATLKRDFILTHTEAIPVLVLTCPGTGQIKTDQELAKYDAERKRQRAQLRRKKL